MRKRSQTVLALLLLAIPVRASVAAESAALPKLGRGPALIAPALRATDLDRSIKYYTTGLGMSVASTLHRGSVTEVSLAFDGTVGQPGILIFRDETSGKSPAVDHGNAAGRVILSMPDVAATATRLKMAGYPTGAIHDTGNVRVLGTKDPDGYAYELVQLPAGEIKLPKPKN